MGKMCELPGGMTVPVVVRVVTKKERDPKNQVYSIPEYPPEKFFVFLTAAGGIEVRVELD